MNPVNAQNALKQYGKMSAKLDATEVSSHRLIQMLMEGALDKIAIAKGHMTRKEIKEKGSYISWSISIIEGLRASLDFEKGGEIAANLEALYDYMQRRLVEANLQNDVAMLDEVAGLLKNIKTAWDEVGQAQSGKPTDNPVATE
ncbi:MAG: flagellar export chaperone FliS [Gammaproteobacteria bacterium]|nr:flagellar export chaperone FliS [Gammaproteobacteria bacterium]